MYLDKCRFFYEKYGRKMIHEKFREYENRIAVGVVGEGSDCFGYDDDYSTDHDYGIGFCMWLSEHDYEKIGYLLQKEYKCLMLTHEKDIHELFGYIPNGNIFLSGRRGVYPVNGFYERILGIKIKNKTEFLINEEDWMKIPEEKLATAVNGQIFRDDEGTFSFLREKIKSYYPKKIWMLRLAEQIHIFSQNGQYNYARMMARKDYLTADICAAQAEKSAMSVVYLLNKKYAPYYKWMRKGMDDLEILQDVSCILDNISILDNQDLAWEKESYHSSKINKYDKKVAAFESIAELILKELNRQHIINGKEVFLDIYCQDIVSQIKGDRL